MIQEVKRMAIHLRLYIVAFTNSVHYTEGVKNGWGRKRN